MGIENIGAYNGMINAQQPFLPPTSAPPVKDQFAKILDKAEKKSEPAETDILKSPKAFSPDAAVKTAGTQETTPSGSIEQLLTEKNEPFNLQFSRIGGMRTEKTAEHVHITVNEKVARFRKRKLCAAYNLKPEPVNTQSRSFNPFIA